jgi:hypothetical protein
VHLPMVYPLATPLCILWQLMTSSIRTPDYSRALQVFLVLDHGVPKVTNYPNIESFLMHYSTLKSLLPFVILCTANCDHTPNMLPEWESR